MSREEENPDSADDPPEDPGACLRCRGEMIEGWVMDVSHRAINQQTWVPGLLSHTWAGAPKLPHKKERKPVVGYRCVGCGYLEFYAR